MSGNQDFVIENSVLTKYEGPGGDATIHGNRGQCIPELHKTEKCDHFGEIGNR